jgi:hypothetical protein
MDIAFCSPRDPRSLAGWARLRRAANDEIPTRPITSGATMTGSSTQGIKTVLHPVSDLETAKAVYAALLGVAPQTDGSYYVGFEAEGQHIGLCPAVDRRA